MVSFTSDIDNYVFKKEKIVFFKWGMTKIKYTYNIEVPIYYPEIDKVQNTIGTKREIEYYKLTNIFPFIKNYGKITTYTKNMI